MSGLWLGAPLGATETAGPLVVPLPALARAESWTVDTNAAAYLRLDTTESALGVRFES